MDGLKVAFAVADGFFAGVQRARTPGRLPLAVVRGGRVMDLTADLRARGAAVGIKRSNLVDLYPEARVVEYRADDYQEAWEGLLDIYAEHVPAVEPLEPPLAFLDVAGLGRDIFPRLGREVRSRLGMAVGFGLGPTKLLARAAGLDWVHHRGSAPSDGQVAEAGAPHRLPVSCLYPMSSKVIAQLQRLGLTSLGQVGACPVQELARQFGWPLARDIALAAGGGSAEPVRPGWPLPRFQVRCSFDGGLGDQAALERALREAGGDLSRRLVQEGLGGEEVALVMSSTTGRRREAVRRFPRLVRGQPTLTTALIQLAARLLGEWSATDPSGSDPPDEIQAEVRRVRPQAAVQTDLSLFRGFESGRAHPGGGERDRARAIDEVVEVIKGTSRRFGEQTVWVAGDDATAATGSRRETLLGFYDPLRAYGQAH